MSDRLDDDTISDRLPDDWIHDGDAITRTYTFEEYLDGVAFASEVGDLADEAFHHPEITIRYDEVEVRFTDHEAGGVTSQDIELARRTDDRR
ncbi:4a-hydroxytetrahydrobiopterin dehydratase [Halobacterium salinarum]|uniref:Putative pterin-4-alpha-carbinolamine dehydratase n=5 Tax=Halobacterium salinarum TaxID=2242 RepID=PHS_HALSA|nr:4a-hydroxytetrahydrobiopterin dehydratase [Halobacterium salinarum]B0R6B9.1 RecName: Full=Putative pterin-4-alpha-carbinolamine dehydratase; Short=PHS; AltName: Full=4-alpha-hydroxy-tetrahydropterin dehydratase; AltName: Full=Pterin carbinolamine dehydratase; Short=PCD [Halobacterium salinarum R1]Q9HP73.1 RecName: Full=Putative pterin-4-alpha-carbinolamine dehydratase; Short=PHS; AltName: Full=4-alpha-hydroxy-tetrahydropterin dehydratase; AltName: Full=Pterin carbinolamine dehydratase; Short=P